MSRGGKGGVGGDRTGGAEGEGSGGRVVARGSAPASTVVFDEIVMLRRITQDPPCQPERVFLIDNLLVRIHL